MIVGLPYQLSIYEGLLSREQIQDEMSEPDYNELIQSMEMECLWFGDADGSLFQYEDIHKARKIKNALLPLDMVNDRNPITKLGDTEERIMSVDVALMNSRGKKKNDASAIIINSAIQTDDVTYSSNEVYAETFEGLTTDELGVIVMRYFYEYKCTQLVLDTNGIGLGVYDFICKDQFDAKTGKQYKALCCCNDEDMVSRCKVSDANKVVWSVKATAAFNNEICVLLRNGLQNGKISLLVDEQDADAVIRESYKGYAKLTATEQAKLKMPYAQTTMTMFELIKLDHEVKNGQIKVKEISGMRKDRYSSLAYNYWVACQLELQLKPRNDTNWLNDIIIRRGKYHGRTI